MKTLGRVVLASVSLAASACAGPSARETADAGPAIDAFHPDIDAFRSDIDAFSNIDGARVTDVGTDAFNTSDATWGPCSSGGVMGVCESTSACPAGSMVMAGLCPGPADIECCLPPPSTIDSGMPGAVTPSEVLARLGACTRIGGDYAKQAGGTANVPICQTANVIWWTADMDIDCDGGLSAICRSDPSYMASTSAVTSTGAPLDASTLPFIVIPLPSTRWRFASAGIALGQVALVIYNGRMRWGIFGDEGPSAIIGEASFAMAEALGIPSSPISGGVSSGVTYVVFPGAAARVAHNESNAEAVSLGMPLLNAFVHP